MRSSRSLHSLIAALKADASFAGQYDSVLGARSLDDVLRAVERVRASGRSDRATAYREHGHLADAPLGVLVQLQIEADAAGVMFSHNPITGDDEVSKVVEAVLFRMPMMGVPVPSPSAGPAEVRIG